MNIGIIGVGGVGGYFGGKLARCFAEDQDHQICFLARGAHLKKIKEQGLTIISNHKEPVNCRPDIITDDLKEFPVLDVCMICVKGYDLKNVLEQLKDRITPETEIIPLLNGIDIPDRIHQVLPDARVYPFCVYIGTYIKEPGVIEQNGGTARIFTGPERGKDETLPHYLPLFKEAGINYLWTKENYDEIWRKYMTVGPFSIVQTYYDKTMGEVCQSSELSEKVRNIAKLILAVGKREGVQLSEECPQQILDMGATFPFDTKTSFQRDFERKDKPVEKETFIDSLVSLAKKYDMDASDDSFGG